LNVGVPGGDAVQAVTESRDGFKPIATAQVNA